MHRLHLSLCYPIYKIEIMLHVHLKFISKKKRDRQWKTVQSTVNCYIHIKS